MACSKRDNTGTCEHHQCEFSSETEHGYVCVDVINGYGAPFCEAGEGCLTKCQYSWQKGSFSEQEQAARRFSAIENEQIGLDDMEVGQSLDDISEQIDQLKNMVYTSDFTSDEKEMMYDLFCQPMAIDEIKHWKTILTMRQKSELTRVQNGELLLQSELKKAIKEAVEKDNT